MTKLEIQNEVGSFGIGIWILILICAPDSYRDVFWRLSFTVQTFKFH